MHFSDTPVLSPFCAFVGMAGSRTVVYKNLAEEEEHLHMYHIRAARRQASPFERLFATWQFSLLRQGYKTQLTKDYTWNLTFNDAVAR